MYIRMVKKQTGYIITIIIILFIQTGLYSQDSVIYLGEEDLWNNVQLTNLSLIEGKRGFLDVTSSDNEYKADKYSDMILPLNSSAEFDKTGNYKIISPIYYVQKKDAFGGAAAFFDGTEPLMIESGTDAMFSPSTIWGDFTLEFRLFPATLREGSTIFLWKGLQMRENHLIPQEIRCTISNRKLVWDFENVFLYPDNTIERVTLSGDKLIPGLWSHHMISYNSQTGLLEYRINNVPSDNVYTTKSGNESEEFNIPLIGTQQSFPIELGENYAGLIDEFRISKNVISNPILNKYSPSGFLETPVIDMKTPGSELIQINSDSETPGNTSIRFQYSISDNKFSFLENDAQWHEFIPSIPINKTGRFVKIRAQLYSETSTDQAPILSNMTMVYKEADPPPPPLNLSIEKTGDNIKLSWKKLINPEIEGYLVYYGEEPGKYLSEGSPRIANRDDFIILEGLDNNKRYYFSVTSYKSLNPRLESIFSEEISISP